MTTDDVLSRAEGELAQGNGSESCPICYSLIHDLAAEVRRLREGDGLMERFGEAFLKLYAESGAKNYLAVALRDGDGVEFEVLLQRIGGETPAAKASRLEGALAAARAEVSMLRSQLRAAEDRAQMRSDESDRAHAEAARLREAVEAAFTEAYQLGSDDNEEGDYLRPERWLASEAKARLT